MVSDKNMIVKHKANLRSNNEEKRHTDNSVDYQYLTILYDSKILLSI